MRKNITIAEIAKEANVSKPVVSAILNKKENKNIFVSDKKKNVILGLIEKYKYMPNKRARDLFCKQTNTLGFIFHRFTPYFSCLIEELQMQAFEMGLDIIPYITKGDPKIEEKHLNLMRDGRVDGVIIAGLTENSAMRYEKFSSFPYNLKMLIMGSLVANIPSVAFDEKEAGRLAAAHLIERGYKKLCFFGGAKEFGRLEGFCSYIKKKKNVAPPLIFTGENFVNYFPEGKKLAREFLKLNKLPDGVFAFNDLLGVALVTELLKHGIKIPEDIAIVGCDNTEVCLHSYPNLTSIDTNISLTVKNALERILDCINEIKIEPLHTKIPVNLVTRNSVRKKMVSRK